MPATESLFKRACEVTVWQETIPSDPTQFVPTRLPNAIEIKDLRVRFKVEHSLTKHPNTCSITVTNLASKTRSWLEQRPLYAEIQAGYGNTLHLLFTGDVRFSMSELKHPDWETLLQLGDGDCNFRWARVDRSYRPPVTVRTVIENAARSMGYTLPANLAKDPALNAQLTAGTVSHGPARDELTRMLAPFGYHWSVQHGQLQVLRDDEVSSTGAIPISEQTGMIGTPEFGSPPRSGKPPHMRIKMLLYPGILPGALINLSSIAKSGLFRVQKVSHEGDSHGDAWFTELEVKPY